MDRDRFDTIARLIAKTGSRRQVVGILLGVSLLAPSSTLRAGPGKEKGHRNCRGQGHLKALGRGHGDKECDTRCPPDPRTGIPGFRCADGFCSCGSKCCGDRCFEDFRGTESAKEEFCCTGPKQEFCPGETQLQDPACCPKSPGREEPGTDPCSCFGSTGLPTRYRRP
jgi:hypothetical protein